MKRDACIDFHLVPDRQLAMHGRLENWALSVRNGQSSGVAPMFRWYRSSEHWGSVSVRMPVDQADATRIQKGLKDLPPKNLHSLNWYYVYPGVPPWVARREIGCTLEALRVYVVDGRSMLINRRV